jgi:hypothetical protein
MAAIILKDVAEMILAVPEDCTVSIKRHAPALRRNEVIGGSMWIAQKLLTQLALRGNQVFILLTRRRFGDHTGKECFRRSDHNGLLAFEYQMTASYFGPAGEICFRKVTHAVSGLAIFKCPPGEGLDI